MHLKQVCPDWNIWAKIDTCNIIDYDVKSYQVKNTTVNCTDIRLK